MLKVSACKYVCITYTECHHMLQVPMRRRALQLFEQWAVQALGSTHVPSRHTANLHTHDANRMVLLLPRPAAGKVDTANQLLRA